MSEEFEGMNVIQDLLGELDKDIPDDGKEIRRPLEKQHRGMDIEQMRNCPLQIGATYTVVVFDLETRKNVLRSVKITGIFYDGYAYIDL